MPRHRCNSPPPPLDGFVPGDIANQVCTASAVDLAGNGLAIKVTAYSPSGCTSLCPLVSYSTTAYSPACAPVRPRPRATRSQGETRRRPSTHHFVISPVMVNTCLPPSRSRLRIHRHSSVASRPRNPRGMLRRASGRAERDGARGEASTHSGLRPGIEPLC
jgi:hypothetical protein